MVTRCIIKGCGKAKRDGVSHHRFPSDPLYKKVWINFVQRTRPDFKRPSFCSYLCSDHFTTDMFHPASLNRIKHGLSDRYHLTNIAIPTILHSITKNRNDKTRGCAVDEDILIKKRAINDCISQQQRVLVDEQLVKVGNIY